MWLGSRSICLAATPRYVDALAYLRSVQMEYKCQHLFVGRYEAAQLQQQAVKGCFSLRRQLYTARPRAGAQYSTGRA